MMLEPSEIPSKVRPYSFFPCSLLLILLLLYKDAFANVPTRQTPLDKHPVIMDGNVRPRQKVFSVPPMYGIDGVELTLIMSRPYRGLLTRRSDIYAEMGSQLLVDAYSVAYPIILQKLFGLSAPKNFQLSALSIDEDVFEFNATLSSLAINVPASATDTSLLPADVVAPYFSAAIATLKQLTNPASLKPWAAALVRGAASRVYVASLRIGATHELLAREIYGNGDYSFAHVEPSTAADAMNEMARNLFLPNLMEDAANKAKLVLHHLFRTLLDRSDAFGVQPDPQVASSFSVVAGLPLHKSTDVIVKGLREILQASGTVVSPLPAGVLSRATNEDLSSATAQSFNLARKRLEDVLAFATTQKTSPRSSSDISAVLDAKLQLQRSSDATAFSTRASVVAPVAQNQRFNVSLLRVGSAQVPLALKVNASEASCFDNACNKLVIRAVAANSGWQSGDAQWKDVCHFAEVAQFSAFAEFSSENATVATPADVGSVRVDAKYSCLPDRLVVDATVALPCIGTCSPQVVAVVLPQYLRRFVAFLKPLVNRDLLINTFVDAQRRDAHKRTIGDFSDYTSMVLQHTASRAMNWTVPPQVEHFGSAAWVLSLDAAQTQQKLWDAMSPERIALSVVTESAALGARAVQVLGALLHATPTGSANVQPPRRQRRQDSNSSFPVPPSRCTLDHAAYVWNKTSVIASYRIPAALFKQLPVTFVSRLLWFRLFMRVRAEGAFSYFASPRIWRPCCDGADGYLTVDWLTGDFPEQPDNEGRSARVLQKALEDGFSAEDWAAAVSEEINRRPLMQQTSSYWTELLWPIAVAARQSSLSVSSLPDALFAPDIGGPTALWQTLPSGSFAVLNAVPPTAAPDGYVKCHAM